MPVPVPLPVLVRKLTVPFGNELVDIDEQRKQHVQQVEARLVAVQRN